MGACNALMQELCKVIVGEIIAQQLLGITVQE
jgi:hypothetical protein